MIVHKHICYILYMSVHKQILLNALKCRSVRRQMNVSEWMLESMNIYFLQVWRVGVAVGMVTVWRVVVGVVTVWGRGVAVGVVTVRGVGVAVVTVRGRGVTTQHSQRSGGRAPLTLSFHLVTPFWTMRTWRMGRGRGGGGEGKESKRDREGREKAGHLFHFITSRLLHHR